MSSAGGKTRNHLDHLNAVFAVQYSKQPLYRALDYVSWPHVRKAHKPVARNAVDYAKSLEVRFRTELFEALSSIQNLAVRLGDVRKDNNRFWILGAKPQKAFWQVA